MSKTKLSIENGAVATLRSDDFSSIREDFVASHNQDNLRNIPLDEFDQYLVPCLNKSQNGNSYLASACEEIDALIESLHSEASTSLPLSSSVASTSMIQRLSESHPIELVYDLESDYKPRYKSDYFAQNGTVRAPRFVTDCNGNHFVTLRILSGLSGWIRVDWITVKNNSGICYLMPYKFQINHNTDDGTDENPCYYPIDTDQNGFMKIELALIKGKQDTLRDAQPLRRFPPIQTSTQSNEIQETPQLPPKDLIEQYELTKSQLAFTYCSQNSDDTATVHWKSTIYSAIMTEQVPETNQKRTVCCPHCTYTFRLPSDDNNVSSKRKRLTNE